MSHRALLRLSTAVLLFWPCLAAGAARELYPEPPDEAIRAKGKGQEVLWRLPVGTALPEDLRFLSPDRVLVGLRQEDQGLANLPILLVDAGTGKVLWSFDRSRRAGVFRPVLLTERVLAYVVEGKGGKTLLSLDAAAGKERWSADLPGSRALALPFPDGGSILVAGQGKKGITLAVKDALTGTDRWSVAVPLPNPAAEYPSPLISTEGLWHLYGGVTRLDPLTGKVLWSRADIALAMGGPPPEISGDRLFLAVGPEIHCLKSATGQTLWQAPLGVLRPSNLYAVADRLYVRGAVGEGSTPHRLAAFVASDGRLLWIHDRAEPVVSNLLQYPGLLVLATGTSVVGLSASTGKELFTTTISSTGRSFPVRLRPYADRVVFLGELSMAAVEVSSGRKLWSKGMSPVSAEASLSSLDGSIPRLTEELAGVGKGRVDYGATLAGQLLVQYQQDTARYNRQYTEATLKGEYWEADKARLQGQVSSAFEQMQSTISFCLSAMEAAEWIRRAMEAAKTRGLLERHEILRRSIVAGYGQAEGPVWALRPNRKYRTTTDDFVGVSLVSLPAGEERFLPLSPAYLSCGLWNLYEPGKGIVIHHGIGLDPEEYRLGEAHKLPLYGNTRTIETSLIAVRVK